MQRSVLWMGLASMYAAAIAVAAEVTVLPTDLSWGNPPGENGGGGHSAITATAPRSGTGSLEIFGDRTRFFGLGNPYSSASNIGLLSNVTSLTFDWSIAPGSTSLLDADYTPALRLHVWDAAGIQRSELIWEGAYNGTYGTTTKGTWYTSGAADNFWQYVSGVGPTLVYDRNLSEWAGIYGPGAYISAVSIGAGSSVGGGYHAMADNVTLNFGATSTTYNFEVPAASVPDTGSSLALFLAAMAGLIGLRRKLSN